MTTYKWEIDAGLDYMEEESMYPTPLPPSPLKWIVQDNLFSEDGYVRLIDALDRLDQDYEIVKVIPFAHELIPDVDYPKDQKVIVMGSDSLIKVSQKKGWWPGAFTNDNFDHRMWVEMHGNELLNHDAIVMKFGDVTPPQDGDAFFIRPAIDFKIFAGTVITPENFMSWQEKAVAYGDTLNADTEVVVAPYRKILQEYRFFVSGNHIVTCSSYKIGDRVISSPIVDNDVAFYARSLMQRWHPAWAYVMDIARTPDGFKLIEYNCINGSGFYACDCMNIVSELAHLCERYPMSMDIRGEQHAQYEDIPLEEYYALKKHYSSN